MSESLKSAVSGYVRVGVALASRPLPLSHSWQEHGSPVPARLVSALLDESYAESDLSYVLYVVALPGIEHLEYAYASAGQQVCSSSVWLSDTHRYAWIDLTATGDARRIVSGVAPLSLS